jgi:hypothetical protein
MRASNLDVVIGTWGVWLADQLDLAMDIESKRSALERETTRRHEGRACHTRRQFFVELVSGG